MASGSRRHDEQGTGQVARVAWTTTPANYDIQASDPTGEKRCCREIVIATAGTLVIVGPDGVSVTLPSGPLRWGLQAQALTAAGSSAQGVVVIW
jgi:hypothetical protein